MLPDRVVYSTPVLQALTRTKKAKYWRGWVLTDGTNYFTRREYWQEGSVHQWSEPKRVVPKNVGRANETEPKAQAIAEIESLMRKQRDEGYREKGEAYDGLVLPMLAHEWSKRKHTVQYPVYVQPKLDGVRALTDGQRFWSRKGKLFQSDIVAHLQCFVSTNTVLDGEFMLPPPATFQDITSYTKDRKPDGDRLEYHVFDVVDPTVGYSTRAHRASCLLLDVRAPAQMQLVATIVAHSEAEVDAAHARFMQQGYEGTMVRLMDAGYDVGNRSTSLLKKKDFVDDDFLIIGFTDGEAREEGAILFECQTPAGLTFMVRPRGSYEQRRAQFARGTSFIGKLLKVRYQNLSDDGIPRFPVGLGVRED